MEDGRLAGEGPPEVDTEEEARQPIPEYRRELKNAPAPDSDDDYGEEEPSDPLEKLEKLKNEVKQTKQSKEDKFREAQRTGVMQLDTSGDEEYKDPRTTAKKLDDEEIYLNPDKIKNT